MNNHKPYLFISAAIIIAVVAVLCLNRVRENQDNILKEAIKSEIESLSSEIHFLQDQQQVMIDSIAKYSALLKALEVKEINITNNYTDEISKRDNLSVDSSIAVFQSDGKRLDKLRKSGYFRPRHDLDTDDGR